MFNKKNNVSILTTKWEPIKEVLNYQRFQEEMNIFLLKTSNVINVIHTLEFRKYFIMLVKLVLIINQLNKF
jgi:hypothetical protein